MITSPRTHFSIPTNLALLNTIPQKLCLSLYITNWSLPSAISKSPVYVSSTSLLHLTLYIIAFSSSDFPPGSAYLALLYFDSNPRLNPSHSPVVSLKAPSWAHSLSSCIVIVSSKLLKRHSKASAGHQLIHERCVKSERFSKE